jgi:hypothetical protein
MGRLETLEHVSKNRPGSGHVNKRVRSQVTDGKYFASSDVPSLFMSVLILRMTTLMGVSVATLTSACSLSTISCMRRRSLRSLSKALIICAGRGGLLGIEHLAAGQHQAGETDLGLAALAPHVLPHAVHGVIIDGLE